MKYERFAAGSISMVPIWANETVLVSNRKSRTRKLQCSTPSGFHVRPRSDRLESPMDYDYNRLAFRSVVNAPTVEPLAATYCACVLLELGLKQHLKLCSTSLNGGHDLPQLLQRVSNRTPRVSPVVNSLQAQLAFSIAKLISQGKSGQARTVPANSYPHIRYLRHSQDWPAQHSSEADLKSLQQILKRISHYLTTSAGVSL